jgi:plastocyanin
MEKRKLPTILAGVIMVIALVSLSVSGCTKSATTPMTPGTPASSGNNVTINLTQHNSTFSPNTITVPAGASVTINFNNEDNGLSEDFLLMTKPYGSDNQSRVFTGQIVKGPATIVYQFTAPANPGTYYFYSETDTTNLHGTFIVQ